MTGSLFGGNRRLLFRSYLLLVTALLAVAFGLQLAYNALSSADRTQNDPWLQSTLRIVAAELEAAAPADREIVAAELSGILGMNVRLLQRDEIAASADLELEALVNDDGDTFYLYTPPGLDELIYVGPVPVAEERWLLRAGPALFYLSIVVVVGLWLRPILRDINRMTTAAQRFAADYRTPLKTADATTELTTLARNLDDMSLRLSSLIQNQKELIAALSHEMRTPLARIRFALAVMGNDASDEVRRQFGSINDDIQEIDDLISRPATCSATPSATRRRGCACGSPGAGTGSRCWSTTMVAVYLKPRGRRSSRLSRGSTTAAVARRAATASGSPLSPASPHCMAAMRASASPRISAAPRSPCAGSRVDHRGGAGTRRN